MRLVFPIHAVNNQQRAEEVAALSTNQFDKARERRDTESSQYREGYQSGKAQGREQGRDDARREFREKPLRKRLGDALRPR